ncbi:hypothetical protein TruAng_007987 [Truncatella angustata]|nr:hypothetical protein TruAng_007987 [Truncatella angustata]
MHFSQYLLLSIQIAGTVVSSAALFEFGEPPVQYRPKFRYWLPDASVPYQSVVDDVDHIVSVGAGGLEFLPFYNYGLGPALTDWSIYGFGTEAFKAFDLALGANQGAGVPSIVETPGLAKELVYGNITIQSGETYTGLVPEPNPDFNKITGFMNTPELWGANEIVAVVAGKIITDVLLAQYFYMSILDEMSLVDLTNLTIQGNLSWTAPKGDGNWIVFGIYERYTNQRSCASVTNATTALGNGSWIVDHWSSSGAKKMTDFWDQQILSNDTIDALVTETGQYIWEDSMEMQAALPWTRGLLSRFEALHGYSATKFLPILFHATNTWGGYLPPYNITYTLGRYATDGGAYVQDYKAALSQGYLEYLEHYNGWASSRGLKLSTQPAYNMPVDMTQAVAHVQVPELESLGFSESINNYRQFTGAAHLAGRNIISTEVGATLGNAYKQRIPHLKGLFDESFAAGVNAMVLHGYAYSGEYVGTTWPGYTPFQYQYSEMWNPRQPAWKHLDDLMSYSARNSMVIQLGVPKFDLAFYYFDIPYRFGAGSYNQSDMNTYGYTFEYLGPDNLVSGPAVAAGGILAPDGPGYKAMVIYNQTQITPRASAALTVFARNGLPIYIVGTIPNITIGTTGQQEVLANMEELLTYDVVHVLETDDFSASTLFADSVLPRVNTHGDSGASSLYTFWRSDTKSDSEYVYLYNTGADKTFNVSFSVLPNSSPEIFNAWTGDQIPLAVYQTTSTGITTSISLKSNQTTIIGFSASATQDRVFVVDHSPNVETIRVAKCIEAWVADSSEAWVTLSNEIRVVIPAAANVPPAVTTLGPWNLAVDAYGPSDNNYNVKGEITTINVGRLDNLVPWTNISRIEQISGVGMYSTNFDLYSYDQTAILVYFGPILHTLRAWVNGHHLSPVDPTNPVSDISDLVGAGSNKLDIEVTTSLFNAVKANIGRVFSAGYGPKTPTYYTAEDWHEFGLVGPVELRTMRKLCVA